MDEVKYQFSVIWGPYPFLERPGKKKFRPLLCLSTKPVGRFKLLVVAFVSSKVREKLETDVFLGSKSSGFSGTGLKTSSYIRLHKLGSIPMSKMEGIVGYLPTELQSEVKKRFRKLFGI